MNNSPTALLYRYFQITSDFGFLGLKATYFYEASQSVLRAESNLVYRLAL
jgi:hypothetical protein